MRWLALFLALAGCGGIDGQKFRPTMGGDGEAYIDQVNAATGTMHLDGTYVSAGTLYLAYPDLCITPNSSFVFHGPVPFGMTYDAAIDRIVYVYGVGSPDLAAWYDREYRGLGAVVGSNKYRTFTGAEIVSRFGIGRHC